MLNPWRNVRALTKNARTFTELVRIVEAGPRDGLRSMKDVPTSTKIELVNKLSETGLRTVKVTSLGSTKRASSQITTDSAEVYEGILKNPNVEYSVEAPSLEALKNAADLGVKEVEFTVGASETLNRRNLNNASIAESLMSYRVARKLCRERKIRARGAITGVLGCPHEGDVEPRAVAGIVEDLFEMGCHEVLLKDCVGAATPKKLLRLLGELKAVTGGDVWRFAVEFRDARGQALVNVYECLEQGIRVFDASIAGLGDGLATEELVYLLDGQGMETKVDFEKLVRVGEYVARSLPNAGNNSKVGRSFLVGEKRRAPSC